MRKYLSLFLLLIVTINCWCKTLEIEENKVKYALEQQLKKLDKQQLKTLQDIKILNMYPEYAELGTTTIKGVIVSNIIISEDLVPSIIDRYKISHYIRNNLIHNQEKLLFDSYDEYIKGNSELICKVIYYLHHKKYFRVYSKFPMDGDRFLRDKRLLSSLPKLLKRLKEEDSLFIYGMKMEEVITYDEITYPNFTKNETNE